MTRRVVVFLALSAVVLAATVGYVVWSAREQRSPVSRADPVALADVPEGAVLVRRASSDQSFNLLEYVVPGARRGPVPGRCDRVDAASDGKVACLAAVTSVVARTQVTVWARDGSVVRSWRTGGIPSRTRLSPDGSHVATTVFVDGHSYLATGFSTATEVTDLTDGTRDNLEGYRLEVDGRTVRPVDRNFWGVTFSQDGDTFYATLSTRGRTWLVRGSLRDRVLRTVHEQAECPALSPDETRVAYKKRFVRPGAAWTLAVLDLATGEETLLGERRTVDDQVEWLDDDTLLYGLPREGEPGSSDVWALDVGADAEPRRFARDAASPAVWTAG